MASHRSQADTDGEDYQGYTHVSPPNGLDSFNISKFHQYLAYRSENTVPDVPSYTILVRTRLVVLGRISINQATSRATSPVDTISSFLDDARVPHLEADINFRCTHGDGNENEWEAVISYRLLKVACRRLNNTDPELKTSVRLLVSKKALSKVRIILGSTMRYTRRKVTYASIFEAVPFHAFALLPGKGKCRTLITNAAVELQGRHLSPKARHLSRSWAREAPRLNAKCRASFEAPLFPIGRVSRVSLVPNSGPDRTGKPTPADMTHAPRNLANANLPPSVCGWIRNFPPLMTSEAESVRDAGRKYTGYAAYASRRRAQCVEVGSRGIKDTTVLVVFVIIGTGPGPSLSSPAFPKLSTGTSRFWIFVLYGVLIDRMIVTVVTIVLMENGAGE
ncbi:hypothetical protein C8R47DRAFT_1288584 [Mycena vitilis]|nr:hypothetical protein C8R47DRAFT_1288584 [Mycena vitilis]